MEDRRLLSAAALDDLTAASPEEAEYVPGEILIKLRDEPVPPPPGDSTAEVFGPQLQTASLWGALSYCGIPSLEPVFRDATPYSPAPPWPAPEEPDEETAETDDADMAADCDDLLRWHRAELAQDADMDEALAVFAALVQVEYAEPNYEYGLTYEIPTVIEGLPDATTDPDYGEQWHHAAAKIPNAWDYLNRNGVYPGGPVLIEPGATLTIKEGTQVQWGAISDDPYNPGPQTGNILVRGSLMIEGTQEFGFQFGVPARQ